MLGDYPEIAWSLKGKRTRYQIEFTEQPHQDPRQLGHVRNTIG
jgi:hypothetical protein